MSSRNAIIFLALVFGLSLAMAAVPEESSPPPRGGYIRVRIPPMDEAGKNPEFKRFRGRLLNAVRGRDLKFLMDHLDDDITFSAAGDFGRAAFFRHWGLDQPDLSPLWTELETLLQMGGIFTDDDLNYFVAPYTFINFPTYLPADEFLVVTGEMVAARQKPEPGAPAIEMLNHDVVRCGYRTLVQRRNSASGDWNFVGVTLPTGARAYVNIRYLRSPLDYRAGFSKTGGMWKMMFLVEGD